MTPGRIFPIVAMLTLGMSVPAHAETIQITMENLVISPAEASAKVGDTIEWVNKDIFAHTATARNGDWDVTLQPKKIGRPGFEEGRRSRLLLPLPSEHEGDAHRRAVTAAGRPVTIPAIGILDLRGNRSARANLR